MKKKPIKPCEHRDYGQAFVEVGGFYLLPVRYCKSCDMWQPYVPWGKWHKGPEIGKGLTAYVKATVRLK